MKKIRNITLIILILYIFFVFFQLIYSYNTFSGPEPTIFGDINSWWENFQVNAIFTSYFIGPIIFPSLLLFIYSELNLRQIKNCNKIIKIICYTILVILSLILIGIIIYNIASIFIYLNSMQNLIYLIISHIISTIQIYAFLFSTTIITIFWILNNIKKTTR